MDAIVVKKIIDQNIENVVETIAFSYGEKYDYIVKKRLKSILYYVYDNVYYQIERMENIDLVDIASEFAKDLTANLNVDSQRKSEIEYELGNVIYISRYLGINELIAKKVLEKIPELNFSLNEFIEKLSALVNYYNSDYKVQEVDKRLFDYRCEVQAFDNEIFQWKEQVLKRVCHLKEITKENVVYLWDLLVYFSDSLTFVDEKEKLEFQVEFYQLIGCKGDSLQELINDAHAKGIYLDDEFYYKINEEYERKYKGEFVKLANTQSNIREIFNDLENKGYHLSNDFISTYLMNANDISAAVFSASSSCKDSFNIIIYNNNLSLYSLVSSEIIIHELLHVLGGVNKSIMKNGLYYEENKKYLHLEEAYVNYLSKKIASIYNEEYGLIMPNKHSDSYPCIYDKTLPYLEEVFKEYGKQLMEIHISDTISLNEADKIIPIKKITSSLEKIINADVSEVNDILQKEISNLKKRRII